MITLHVGSISSIIFTRHYFSVPNIPESFSIRVRCGVKHADQKNSCLGKKENTGPAGDPVTYKMKLLHVWLIFDSG